jgi:carbonic anhydrase
VLDPAATVREDVARLSAAPELAASRDSFKIGGYAYDLKTGLLTTIVDPS